MINANKINVHTTLEVFDTSDTPSLDSLYEKLTRLRAENPGKNLEWTPDSFGIEIVEIRPETDEEFELRLATALARKRKTLEQLKLELGEV